MENKRAVGYVRLSQKDRKLSKDEIETSLINQENEIREYCKNKGYNLIEIYKEKYVTGDSPNRPEFNRMLYDSYKKGLEIIVVRDMSRFTREGADKQEDLIIMFGLNKVEIESMSEDISNELTRQTLGFLNKVLVIIGRMKTQQMRLGKKALGRPYFKQPFGYKLVKKKNEYWIPTQDAKKVKELFRMKIAKEELDLVSLGISNKQCRTILNNNNYVGIKLPNGLFKSILYHKHYVRDSKKKIVSIEEEEYFGYHEPLINPFDWLLIHPEDKSNELIKKLNNPTTLA